MAAVSKKPKRSRQDYELELRRLKSMYAALPPEKQAVHRPHMQARIDKLVKAINEDGKKPKKGGGMMQTVMILLLACVVALAAGFFGVTYLAQNG
jgi:hypothetical protein